MKLFRILLEGQAYLYADLNRLRVEGKGGVVTEEMFEGWRKEWAEETQRELAEESESERPRVTQEQIDDV